MKNEIILHQPNQLTEYIEVRIDNEKVVPSRTLGPKQIMVVEALETTVNINSILELL
jgi:hypothetical protein